MKSEPRITMICIDIGMTGSAASWRDNQNLELWKLAFKDGKLPTRLAYDTKNQDEPPVTWGDNCVDLPQQMKVHECFKVFMDQSLPHIDPESRLVVSRANVHRWMRDYMQLICGHVAASIDSILDSEPQWRDDAIHWIFTVPGSWAELPTVADFRRLAEDATYFCIGNRDRSKVITKFTEARASAQCLLKYGSAARVDGYTPGNTVLSCDIGGATTDIAVTQIEAPGLLKIPKQLGMHLTGMMNIDARFILHAQKILNCAGVSNSMEKAQILCRTKFQAAKEEFTGEQTDKWVSFPLLPIWEARIWRPPGNMSSTCTRVDNWEGNGKQLLIHKDTMIELFDDFVNGIEDIIDKSINDLTESGIQLTVIGICGGGSRAAYPVQRLRQRYNNKNITFLDRNNYDFRPELATLYGSTMLYEQEVVREFCKQMRFGIKLNKDDVYWGALSELQGPLDFLTPYAMEVVFEKNTHSLRASIKHDLVAVPRTASALDTFSDALQVSGSRTWRVNINLNKVETQVASLNKKYRVICRISGVWKIETVAETSLPTKRIDCVLI